MPVGQKKSAYPFSWFLPVLAFIFLLDACKKDTDAILIDEGRQVNSGQSSNLVKNPSFVERDLKQQLPLNWTFNFEYNDLTGVKIEPGELSWQRNSQGKFLVSQNIPVKRNRFYKVVMESTYDVRDFSPFGIYVTDETRDSILGKLEKVNTNNSDTLQLLFNSGENSQLQLLFGCPQNMNATVAVKHISIQEIDYDPSPGDNPLAEKLVPQLGLVFTNEGFDNSIRKLCDYINEMLICAYGNTECQDYILTTREIINADAAFPYTIQNLQDPSSINEQYCQRSSLSLFEVLNNVFHIPVRQVHLMFGDTGKHQFIEYWNPFAGKWIAIDPYFSGQFVNNGKLLSADEITISELGSSFRRFGQFVFEPKMEELEKLWIEKDSVRIDPAYYLSYPFN